MGLAEQNQEYWASYSNLQRVKHDIIGNYLRGCFPKLTLGPNGAKKLLYIDTHAGRGTHFSGQLGSPLVAVRALTEHRNRDAILRNTKVHFYLIENDQENCDALKAELAAFTLPANVHVEAETENCFEIIEQRLDELDQRKKPMTPSFIFVDPYGFKVPARLLRKLLSHDRVEVFVNVMWRELDMAIAQANGVHTEVTLPRARSLFDDDDGLESDYSKLERSLVSASERRETFEKTMDIVFGGDSWRQIKAGTSEDRADECAELLRKATGARWGTSIRMQNLGRTRYFLLHLTNHPEGRKWMKDCIWKVCPSGEFTASKSDNPKQKTLIAVKPELNQLKEWVVSHLQSGDKQWSTLSDLLLEEIWLDKHLTDVIRALGKAKGIVSSTQKFFRNADPVLSLSRSYQ